MRIFAVEIINVQRNRGVLRKRMEPFFEEFGVHFAKLRTRHVHAPNQIGAPRNIHTHARAGLIHRNNRVCITRDAAAIPHRFVERLAQSNAGVFGRVVRVNVEIPLRTKVYVHQRVARQLFEHVVEKADARGDVVGTGAVNVEVKGDVGLLSLARMTRTAGRLGRGSHNGSLLVT